MLQFFWNDFGKGGWRTVRWSPGGREEVSAVCDVVFENTHDNNLIPTMRDKKGLCDSVDGLLFCFIYFMTIISTTRHVGRRSSHALLGYVRNSRLASLIESVGDLS